MIVKSPYEIDRSRYAWAPWPGPQSEAYCEWGAKELLYGGSRGGGKVQRCLPPLALAKMMLEYPNLTEEDIKMKYEGLVLTPFGFKPMSDIKVGDAVCNPDGTIAHVVGYHPQPEQEYYRLTFIDGAVVECGEDHLWGVNVSSSSLGKKRGVASVANIDLPEETKWNIRYSQQCRVLNTKDVAERHAKAEAMKSVGRVCVPWLKVPLCRPCEMNGTVGRGHPVPPYTMGVLLGDGTLCVKSTVVWSKPEPQIADEVRAEIEAAGMSYGVNLHADGETYSIVGKDPDRGMFIDMIEAQGLKGARSWDKFVPAYYLRAPKGVRLAIMQGLCDTGGTTDDRGHIEYCTVSERLAKDVQYLARSLGCKATISEKLEPHYTYKGEALTGRKAYRVYICGADNGMLFRLARKKDRCRRYNGGVGDADPYRRLVKVEKIGRFPGACIRVSHPNGLYITNDFVVTHNSSLACGKFLPLSEMFGADARGVIFRRSYPELEEVIAEGHKIFCRPGFATWVGGADKIFRFKTGAELKMRYLSRIQDCDNYQGHQYVYEVYDESTLLPDSRIFEKMKATMRSPNRDIPRQTIFTANPGGPCHSYFVEQFKLNLHPKGRVKIPMRNGYRLFIPSRVTDNLSLAGTDYEDDLRSIEDPVLRAAWLDGDWSAVVGAYFADVFRSDLHVVAIPSGVPRHWQVFRSMDWGSAAPFAVQWWTVATDDEPWAGRYWPRGAIIVIDEWYGTEKKRSNKGLRLSPQEVAAGILEREVRRGYSRVDAGPADTAMWAEDGRPSIATMMSDAGVRFIKAHKERATGWQQVRARLKGDGDNPSLFISDRCENLLETLPIAMRDEKNYDDIDTDQEDHCFPAGVEVLADGGWRRIEEIAAGDRVMTRFGLRRVIAAGQTAMSDSLVRVNGIPCTPDHPFLVERFGWIRAKLLMEIDWIVAHDRDAVRVESIESVTLPEPIPVFNLTVDEHPEFIVRCGDVGIVVHNCLDTLRYICNSLRVKVPENRLTRRTRADDAIIEAVDEIAGY